MATNSNKKRNKSLTQKIYDDLLNKLMSNELTPGTIINRESLAKEYNVSVAPIREALQRLTLEGIVETKSRSATVVKGIKKENVVGILSLREALEVQVARMVCGGKVVHQIDFLMDAALTVDDCKDNIMDYWRADLEFHKAVIKLSECELIINTYIRTMNMQAFYNINSFFHNYEPEKRASHVILLKELMKPNPDGAEAAIRNHLSKGKMIID